MVAAWRESQLSKLGRTREKSVKEKVGSHSTSADAPRALGGASVVLKKTREEMRLQMHLCLKRLEVIPLC